MLLCHGDFNTRLKRRHLGFGVIALYLGPFTSPGKDKFFFEENIVEIQSLVYENQVDQIRCGLLERDCKRLKKSTRVVSRKEIIE